jgi:50S ribosome-binding GTPase
MPANRSSIAGVLERTIEFLKKEASLLLAPHTREGFLERAGDLLEKAQQPSEALYVGIAGGTGVGKSTLINALAKEEISHSSDRRPFTDRAVVYRHQDTARGLNDVGHLIREPDALHDIDRVKDLVLLDLPDFDSGEPANRATVLEILPNLDCLIWVVSPEKYADAALYELIQQTSIDKENFNFVLNKADELKASTAGDPHVRFKEILGDLSFRLRDDAGVEQPRIFCVSAAGEFQGNTSDPILEREFRRFRDFLMVRRDAKEIASVKTVNLAEETRLLLRDLRETVRPEDKTAALASIKGMHHDQEESQEAADLITLDQKEGLARILFRTIMSDDPSIGPVRLGMRVLSLGRPRVGRGADGSLEQAFRATAETLGDQMRVDLEKMCAQMDSEFMLAFSSPIAQSKTGDPRQIIEEASRTASRDFAQAVETLKSALRGRVSGLRRWWQRLVLFLPVPILILKLAGASGVKAWLSSPSISEGFSLVLSFLMSLFSAEALAGLAVLLIFETVLIWYLAAGRIKKIEKLATKLAESGISLLEGRLKDAVEEVRDNRMGTVQQIEEGVNRLSHLEEGFGPKRGPQL